MNKDVLSPGFYVGIRRATRNFSFTVPKLGKGTTDSDMDKWFQSLNNGSKTKSQSNHKSNPSAERSTSFSKWYKTDNAINLSNKCLAAPEIYRVAGGDDYATMKIRITMFKRKAAEVLSRCADTGEAITDAIAAEINVNQCIAHEIKIIVLCVKDTEFPGGRHDENTHMWYMEKVVRKFYVSTPPLDSLLEAFAKEIADPTTTVNAEQKLVVVRGDKVTPNGARVSSFKIQPALDKDITSADQKLLDAVSRIRESQSHPKS